LQTALGDLVTARNTVDISVLAVTVGGGDPRVKPEAQRLLAEYKAAAVRQIPEADRPSLRLDTSVIHAAVFALALESLTGAGSGGGARTKTLLSSLHRRRALCSL
jgi:hypothetical protein